MSKNNLYNEKSIESLPPLEFTRRHPQLYAGDCTYSTQLLIEAFSNAVDEFNGGRGDKIIVTLDGDVCSVADFGQGFLVNSFREDGKTILEAAFSVLNTSGKYREDGSYEGTSLGSFGIGAKIIVFLSNWAVVETWRDGMYERVSFKEGVFKDRVVRPITEDEERDCGTVVKWKPSAEFFTNTIVDKNRVRELFKTISALCQGLTIILSDMKEAAPEIFYSEKGLHDLADAATKGKEIIKNRLYIDEKAGKHRLNLIMTYQEGYNSTFVSYVNTGETESGSHISQLKTALTRGMNNFFKEKGWLKEKDSNLTGDDIQEGIYMLFNYTVPDVRYDAQVKSRVRSIDTKFEISTFSAALQSWLLQNEKDIKKIADKALVARKVREAARRAKELVREGKQEKKKKVLKFSSKLADCHSKDRLNCELLITEGDSASGNLKMARDNEFQAVMPIRGR